MNRRGFLALASGLLVPVPEPVKAYFFAPAVGWLEPAFDPTLRRLGEVCFGETPARGETEDAFRRRLRAKFARIERELLRELSVAKGVPLAVLEGRIC